MHQAHWGGHGAKSLGDCRHHFNRFRGSGKIGNLEPIGRRVRTVDILRNDGIKETRPKRQHRRRGRRADDRSVATKRASTKVCFGVFGAGRRAFGGRHFDGDESDPTSSSIASVDDAEAALAEHTLDTVTPDKLRSDHCLFACTQFLGQATRAPSQGKRFWYSSRDVFAELDAADSRVPAPAAHAKAAATPALARRQ